jgi:hypothetical protein
VQTKTWGGNFQASELLKHASSICSLLHHSQLLILCLLLLLLLEDKDDAAEAAAATHSSSDAIPPHSFTIVASSSSSLTLPLPLPLPSSSIAIMFAVTVITIIMIISNMNIRNAIAGVAADSSGCNPCPMTRTLKLPLENSSNVAQYHLSEKSNIKNLDNFSVYCLYFDTFPIDRKSSRNSIRLINIKT